MKNAACYVRVSTAEQKNKGLSIENQVQALQEYCRANNLNPVFYNDAGYSARKRYTRRPAMQQLLADVEAGAVKIVLFVRLDRWFRSVADYHECQKILDRAGVPWRAIWEEYETETAAGQFTVNIMLAINQAEADRTSEKIKSVMDYKRARGESVTGAVPVGYRMENKKCIIDAGRADAVQAFFRAYLDTLSTDQAIRAARRAGLELTRQHAIRILRSGTYAGDANGVPVPAYITEEEHAAILENMQRRDRRTGSPNRVYLFTGLLYCGHCGGRMQANCQTYKTRAGTKYIMAYACAAHRNSDGDLKRCAQVYTNESKLEAALLCTLEAILAGNGDGIKLQPEKENAPQNKFQRLQRAQQRLARVKELYIDGDLSRDEYEKRKNQLQAEIQELQAVPIMRPPAVRDLPRNWRDIYDDMDREAQKTFWRKIINRITVYSDRDPEIDFK